MVIRKLKTAYIQMQLYQHNKILFVSKVRLRKTIETIEIKVLFSNEM